MVLVISNSGTIEEASPGSSDSSSGNSSSNEGNNQELNTPSNDISNKDSTSANSGNSSSTNTNTNNNNNSNNNGNVSVDDGDEVCTKGDVSQVKEVYLPKYWTLNSVAAQSPSYGSVGLNNYWNNTYGYLKNYSYFAEVAKQDIMSYYGNAIKDVKIILEDPQNMIRISHATVTYFWIRIELNKDKGKWADNSNSFNTTENKEDFRTVALSKNSYGIPNKWVSNSLTEVNRELTNINHIKKLMIIWKIKLLKMPRNSSLIKI